MSASGGADITREMGPGKGFRNWLKRLFYNFLVVFIGGRWSLIETFTRHRKLNFDDLPKRGKTETVVITGGARGIGAEVVKQCLQLDLHVIIGCRTPSAAELLVQKLRDEGVAAGTAEGIALDLNSLESVRQFAQTILDRNIPIQYLINNAGVMFSPFQLSADGHECQFQTNYLAHFYLTTLLLPALHQGGRPDRPSRVVNVSSAAQYGGQIDFENIDLKYNYSPHMSYMTSKLLQVVSSVGFSRKCREEQLNVAVYALHPGVVRTELYKHVWWVNLLGRLLNAMYKTPEQGADGILYVMLSPEVVPEGGAFYANCAQQPVNPVALNLEVQARLHKLSRQMCRLDSVNSSNNNKSFSSQGITVAVK